MVERSGSPVDIGGPKQRAVLALLLMARGHIVAAGRVMEEVWQGVTLARPEASLHAYISNLRRALEPEREQRSPARVLLTEAGGYRILAHEDDVDASRFERLAHEADRLLRAGSVAEAEEVAGAALNLWRGPLLADLADFSFVGVAGVRFDELRMATIEVQLEAQIELGALGSAISELELLSEQHALRENLWRLLMVALYRSGRTADALERFQRARRVLAEEVGLDPGAELRAVERAILAQDDALLQPVRPASSAPRPAPAASRQSGPPLAAPAPAIVGRDQELAEGIRLIDAALAGGGGWIVVEGDAGMGKTRVATALADEAAHRGARVEWVRFPEEPLAPLAPWSGLLGEMPEARPLFDAPAVAASADAAATAASRARHGAALAVAAEARRRPLLIVLDDLHCADAASLELVTAMTSAVHAAPLVVVVTLRQILQTGLLRRALGGIRRQPSSLSLSLRPLDRQQADALGRALAPGLDLAAEDVIFEQSGGNPFYLVELIRWHLAGGGGDVPPAMRDVVAAQLARLDEQARGLVALASVAGESLNIDALSAASGRPRVELLRALAPALHAGLLLLDGDDVRFRHNLVRDAVGSTLEPLERHGHHVALARALARPGATNAAIVAHHIMSASPLVEPHEVVEAAVAAGDEAAHALAFEDAARWYEAAVAAAHRSPAHGGTIGSLLAVAGKALLRAGRAMEGRARLAAAMDEAQQAGDLSSMADAAWHIGGGGGAWHWVETGTYPVPTLRLLERALDALRDGPTASRARVLVVLAEGEQYGPDVPGAARRSAEAVELARATADPAVLADVLARHLLASWGPDATLLLAPAHELLSLRPSVRTIEHDIAGHSFRFIAQLASGRLTEADQAHAAALALAHASGLRAHAASLLGWPATRATLQGDLHRAEALATAAFELHERSGLYLARARHVTALTMIRRAQGRLDEIADEATRTLSDLWPSGTLLAAIACAGRDGAQAEAVLRRVMLARPWPRNWTWLTTTFLAAELACQLGAADLLHDLLADLLPFDEHVAVFGHGTVCLGPVALCLARIEVATGDLQAANGHLRTAVRLGRALGAGRIVDEAEALMATSAAPHQDRH